MAIQFPVGEPTSVKLVGAHSLRGPEFSTVNLTYEYEFDGNWLLTNVALKKQGGRTTIVGLHVYPESMPLEAQNRFSLGGKGPIQYLVLVLAVLLPLFTLAVLVSCIRAKLTGRKWPWVLLILVGVGKFSVNWTTGQWAVSLTSVQLFCASAFAPLYGPWTIAVSLPLGALVFLLLRRRLSEPKAEA